MKLKSKLNVISERLFGEKSQRKLGELATCWRVKTGEDNLDWSGFNIQLIKTRAFLRSGFNSITAQQRDKAILPPVGDFSSDSLSSPNVNIRWDLTTSISIYPPTLAEVEDELSMP